jgi:ParB-like chromosome segregation protein Spo0J
LQQSRFEIVAGARRYRAAQLADLLSVPARIVDIDNAQALEWQLVEDSQRVDVHPYEEAQGFQRLLDIPGYDVAALVEKSGKSASHVYARLSLLQLIPPVAEAFTQERITASHANLIARLPQETHRMITSRSKCCPANNSSRLLSWLTTPPRLPERPLYPMGLGYWHQTVASWAGAAGGPPFPLLAHLHVRCL